LSDRRSTPHTIPVQRALPSTLPKSLKKVYITIVKVKTQGHKMDIEGYLLASGFALLVVLLGWANQITSKSKETKDLEGDFLKKAKLKKSDYKKIVSEGGATEESFKALVDFLYTKKEEDLEIFDKIKHIKEDIDKLDDHYSWRFWVLLCMSICFFLMLWRNYNGRQKRIFP
jgi:hypothetical protein